MNAVARTGGLQVEHLLVALATDEGRAAHAGVRDCDVFGLSGAFDPLDASLRNTALQFDA